jgi:hypothetical protein
MRPLHRILLSAVVVGIAGLAIGAATWSAFSTSTENAGNAFAAGTVTISDNDDGATVMSLSGAVPGTTTTGCIKVTYSGSIAAGVKLYGAVSGALAPYLTLKVTRGADTGTFPNCNFTPDTRDYIGQGAGVVYSGALADFPASHSAGVTDPDNATGSGETWTSPEVHAYKLEVTLQNNLAAQGKSATASFTWEARNQ